MEVTSVLTLFSHHLAIANCPGRLELSFVFRILPFFVSSVQSRDQIPKIEIKQEFKTIRSVLVTIQNTLFNALDVYV